MKGRRKDKTQKWQLCAQFEAEALALAGTRSANQERFVRAIQMGRSTEPIGVMAGTPSPESSAV
ncbi:hypothetical protein EY04_27970 [Pseudomonas chlororaphis]|nr:hypothetical protein EY04_27970 [Pseudomonas chlororaphis]